MKKLLASLLVLCLCIGSMTICASAAADAADGRRKTTFFVKFDGDCVLSAMADGMAQKDAVRRTASSQSAGVRSVQDAVGGEVLYTYTYALNGAAIEAKKRDAAVLRDLDGVADVIELGYARVVREPVVAGAADMVSGGMIGADEMRALGYDGKGTAVAVIDGGLQPDHPAMRLTDESAAKYSKSDIAKILSETKLNVQGVSADNVYKNAKVPFAYDYNDKDTEVNDYHDASPDHGTHVSGIAAGNSDDLTGVAPEAQVLMFKVNLSDEKVFLATLLAALDDASKFDVAAINMSVGIDFEMPNDPAYKLLSEAADNARANGILVCAAAGNSALSNSIAAFPDNGTGGIPNALPSVTSVASLDNLYSQSMDYYVNAFVYDDDKTVTSLDSTAGFPKEGDLAPVSKLGIVGNLEGKIALVYDTSGSSEFYYLKLRNKKMAGVIVPESLYDLAASLVWSNDVQAAVVSDMDAYRLLHSKSQHVTAQFAQYHSTPTEQLQISEFSSYGVSEDLKMTVDVAAPGGNILSSVTGDRYELMGGTSMACPHTVGAAALLRQYMQTAYPDVTGKARADLMENLLMSTAAPVITEDVPTSPRAVGAGLIHVADAAQAQAILTGKDGRCALNLGDGIEDSFKLSFTVSNVSGKAVRYDSLTLDVLTDDFEQIKEFDNLNGEFKTFNTINGKSVALKNTFTSDMPRSITLQPGESRVITASVSLDAGQLAENAEIFTNGFYVEGYVHLENLKGEAAALSIPFMGFRGDWLESPALMYSQEYPDYFYEDGDFYYVMRNLRTLKIELVDEAGKVADSTEREWVKKGEVLYADDIASMFDEAPEEGVYTLRLTAVLDAPGSAEDPQIYTAKEPFVIDFTPVKILSVQSTRQSGGKYKLEITTNASDVSYFALNGRSLLNFRFVDYYPTEEYDHVDADGNYVYVLEGAKYSDALLVIFAEDTVGNLSQYHHYLPLALLLHSVANAFGTAADRFINWIVSVF